MPTINVIIIRGIPIMWWNGEKVVVNGDLYIADKEGENPQNILEKIKDLDNLVVDSLDENSTTKAPSIRAVNEALSSIIEKGNNANGSYIKYSDGTLICYGSKSGTSNLSDYWGQFKRTDENSTLNFPVEFSEIPESVQLTGDSYSSCVCTLIKNITTTQLTFFCLKPNSVTSKDYGVKWFVIGKWK